MTSPGACHAPRGWPAVPAAPGRVRGVALDCGVDRSGESHGDQELASVCARERPRPRPPKIAHDSRLPDDSSRGETQAGELTARETALSERDSRQLLLSIALGGSPRLTPKLAALTSGFPEIDAPARACRGGRRPSRLVARPNDAPAQLVHDRRLAARMPDVGRRELDAWRGACSPCAGDGFGHYRCSFRLSVRRCGTRTTRMCPWASPSCPTVTHAGPSLTTATLQVTGPACTRHAILGELPGQLQSTGRAVATVETCVAVATWMGRQHRA